MTLISSTNDYEKKIVIGSENSNNICNNSDITIMNDHNKRLLVLLLLTLILTTTCYRLVSKILVSVTMLAWRTCPCTAAPSTAQEFTKAGLRSWLCVLDVYLNISFFLGYVFLFCPCFIHLFIVIPYIFFSQNKMKGKKCVYLCNKVCYGLYCPSFFKMYAFSSASGVQYNINLAVLISTRTLLKEFDTGIISLPSILSLMSCTQCGKINEVPAPLNNYFDVV